MPQPISTVRRRGVDIDVPFEPDVRQYHMHVLGTPGSGKTKFLEACIRADIMNRHGVLMIDPAGNLYYDLIRWMARYRIFSQRRIVLINPCDPDFTFAFNPLEIHRDSNDTELTLDIKIEQVVSSTMSAIGAIRADEDPASMPEYFTVMKMILRLLAANDLTLADSHLITDFRALSTREALMKAPGVGPVREQWKQLNQHHVRRFEEMMRAPKNRFSLFNAPTILSIVGQQKSSFNFQKIMDEGAVVLCNMGQSTEAATGEESTMLGRLILHNVKIAAGRRIRTEQRDPRPYYCYIDECDLYLNNDVATSIDKLRQFGLRMILSHQNIGQLDNAGDKVKASVLGSQGTRVYFRLSDHDAQELVSSVYSGRIDMETIKENVLAPAVVGHHRELSESRSDARSSSSATGDTSVTGNSSMTASGITFSGDGTDLLDLFGGSTMSSTNITSAGKSDAQASSKASSKTVTESVSIGEMLVPDIELIATQTYSLDEHLFKVKHELTHLPLGKCIVCTPTDVSFDADVNWVKNPLVSHTQARRAETEFYRKHHRMYKKKELIYASILQKRTADSEANNDLSDSFGWD